MDVVSQLIDAMKTPTCTRIDARHMVAVIRKLFTWSEPRRFAHDFIAFDHELAAVRVINDPFAPEQRDGAIGAIVNRNEIDERVWFVGRQAHAPVVIDQFV